MNVSPWMPNVISAPELYEKEYLYLKKRQLGTSEFVVYPDRGYEKPDK